MQNPNKMRLTLQVTKDDIDKGVRGSCWRCPIARTLARAGFKDIRVGFEYIVATHKGRNWYAWVSDYVADRIERFDKDGVMEPFELRLLMHEGKAQPSTEIGHVE